MIAQLTGTVVGMSATAIVLDVNGVGYVVNSTNTVVTRARVGETMKVYTALVVREDSMTLFGFSSVDEREAFEMVQKAPGVGPKLASTIVNCLDPTRLRVAIQSGDVATLCSVPGIGKRGAEKIIVELKDKVASLGSDQTESKTVQSTALWRGQISSGLQSLGWSAKDSEAACDAIADEVEASVEISLGQMMKLALAHLGRNR